MARKTYVSIAEMAQRYGYTFNAVKSWRAEGLPYSDNPRGIPELEGTQWIVQNRINPLRQTSVKEQLDIAKLREQEAKADLAQIQVHEKSGVLIPVDFVQTQLSNYLAEIKSTLRLIPAKYAQEILEQATCVSTLKSALRTVIDQSLTDIGELLLVDSIDTDEPEQSEQELDSESDPEQEIDLS